MTDSTANGHIGKKTCLNEEKGNTGIRRSEPREQFFKFCRAAHNDEQQLQQAAAAAATTQQYSDKLHSSRQVLQYATAGGCGGQSPGNRIRSSEHDYMHAWHIR